MKRNWLAIALIAVLALTMLCLLAQIALAPVPGHAQAIEPDPYEPDDPGTGDPPWIADGEAQNRSFYPESDVDRARLYVKAGHWYQVQTQGLGPLVDTILAVEVSGKVFEDDDGGAEPLASHVLFQAPADGLAMVTVANRQAVYGAEQTYKLTAGETAAPTATPTCTPRPTHQPPPTATPPRPVINFSATPEHLARPGDCAILRWSVDRASEVFLVWPNGNQEGVEGLGERQVCPLLTSEYLLKVNASGGNETVRVQITVPLPTPTAAPTSRPVSSSGEAPVSAGRATLHVVVFVDENHDDTYDLNEGVDGALVTLISQANPGHLTIQVTDTQGQAHFAGTAAGPYTVLIPHLGQAEAVSLRGEELMVSISLPALRLPVRIP